MKKIIIFLMLFIPVLGYAQSNFNNDDVIININISKLSRKAGKVINFFKSEYSQYKQELKENIDTEPVEILKDSLKAYAKYEWQYTKDAAHHGWVQGLRGEKYSPPYKDKYKKEE